MPSIAFKTALPVKPSATTTSQTPFKISLDSTLPTKLILLSATIKLCASSVNLLPLCGSVPLFNKPILGFLIFLTLSA